MSQAKRAGNFAARSVRAEPPPDARICRGPILAHNGSYGMAVKEWEFEDARVRPHGPLTPEQVSQLPHS